MNIALINEMHQLYTSIGINTNDVIEAASTKWNFMKLIPGMVGGHCISIDPYYLMHKSEISGYSPNLMRTARKINDEMHEWVLTDFIRYMNKMDIDLESTEITVLGYSFKENCSDIRNTQINNLQAHHMKVPYLQVNFATKAVYQKNKCPLLQQLSIGQHKLAALIAEDYALRQVHR